MGIQRKIIIIFILLSSGLVRAQKVDVGVLLGGSYYYGDVVNSLDLKSIGPSAGAFIRYRIGQRLALRAFAGYAKIQGDDKNSTSDWQVSRNWNFESTITEGSLIAEFNLKADRNTGRRFMNPLVPYVFAGVGYFTFDPKTDINGTLVSTAPLKLSGISYATSAICVPVGLGFRYYIAKKFQLGFEMGIRYTTTSYLDDIAPENRYVDPDITTSPSITRLIYSRSISDKNIGDYRSKMGTPKDVYGSGIVNRIIQNSDFYFMYGLTAAYTIGGKSGRGGRGGRGPSGKAIRCPRFY
jgi:hypothetical protein